MKKILGLTLVSTLVLLGACTSNNTTDSTATSSTTTESSTKQSSTTTTSSTEMTSETTTSTEGTEVAVELGAKENPAALGQAVSLPMTYTDAAGQSHTAILSMTMNSLASGDDAYYQMHDIDPSNPNSPEGQEWLLLDFTIMMNSEDQTAAIEVDNTFSIETAAGEEFAQQVSANLGDQAYSAATLTNGTIITGKISLLHPAGDDSLIVYNAPNGTDHLYWKL